MPLKYPLIIIRSLILCSALISYRFKIVNMSTLIINKSMTIYSSTLTSFVVICDTMIQFIFLKQA